jgi:hypothetical protein
MAVNTVNGWLRKRRRDGCIVSVLSAMLAGGVGLVMLLITFGLLYLAIFTVASAFARGQADANWPLAITVFLMAFICLDAVRGGGEAMFDSWRSVHWTLRDCLGAGPRLLFAGYRDAERAVRLTRLDLAFCEQILSHLATKNQSVSKEELMHTFPTLVWSKLVGQLLLLEGVLFFRPDFSRVTLIEPVRLELRQFLPRTRPAEPRTRAQARPAPDPVPVTNPGQLSHYELLGISPRASLAEIKTAYRNRIKECHPDRFASAGSEYQHLAEEWSKAINAAYETLIAQKGGA